MIHGRVGFLGLKITCFQDSQGKGIFFDDFIAAGIVISC